MLYRKVRYQKAPWRIVDDYSIEADGAYGIIVPVARCYVKAASGGSRENAIANAKRIIECVNSLEGIENPTEWVAKMKELEASVLK